MSRRLGYVGYIPKSPKRDFFGDAWVRGGSGTIFFRKLTIGVESLGFLACIGQVSDRLHPYPNNRPRSPPPPPSPRPQFVGGMGESDAGVWFGPSRGAPDALHSWEFIQTSIARVKTSRHGVPFGLYTSGLGLDAADVPPLQELGLSRVQVSLLAPTPADYGHAAGLTEAQANECFGQLCTFIAAAAEAGFPIEVSVLARYAGAARDLATALGAVDVHVYPE